MKNSLLGEFLYKAHVTFYMVIMVFSILIAVAQGYNTYSGGAAFFFLFALIWGFALAMHSHHYAERKGYGNARRDDRQAYRDGFNDAIRELRNNQSSRIPSRLSIDDYLGEDGELYDEYERDYEKQKRN